MTDLSSAVTIIAGLGGLIGVAYPIIKDKASLNEKNLHGVRRILERRSIITVSPKYIKDLELKSVPCLNGFKWSEVDSLLDINIGIMEISNLRVLSKRGFLAIKEDKIYIPNRKYILSRHKNIKSFIFVAAFVFLAGFIVYAITKSLLDPFHYILLYLFLLVFEIIIIHNFDDLMSLNIIEESESLNESIYISEDFNSCLNNS